MFLIYVYENNRFVSSLELHTTHTKLLVILYQGHACLLSTS